MEKYVLDTSYILRSEIIPRNSYTVKEVLSELDSLNKSKILNVIILNPKKESLEYVKGKIRGEKLSKTDLKLLALAYQLNAILLTDDTDLQSVALRVGVRVKGYRFNLQKPKRKRYRCPNCGRFYSKPYCPICGIKLY